MANMAHCRFHNTLSDLRDCYEQMEEVDCLSEGEAAARLRLIKLAKLIAADYDNEEGT